MSQISKLDKLIKKMNTAKILCSILLPTLLVAGIILSTKHLGFLGLAIPAGYATVCVIPVCFSMSKRYAKIKNFCLQLTTGGINRVSTFAKVNGISDRKAVRIIRSISRKGFAGNILITGDNIELLQPSVFIERECPSCGAKRSSFEAKNCEYCNYLFDPASLPKVHR